MTVERERSLPPGWDESHLEAYREGYSDGLLWALEHEPEEIMGVLEEMPTTNPQ